MTQPTTADHRTLYTMATEEAERSPDASRYLYKSPGDDNSFLTYRRDDTTMNAHINRYLSDQTLRDGIQAYADPDTLKVGGFMHSFDSSYLDDHDLFDINEFTINVTLDLHSNPLPQVIELPPTEEERDGWFSVMNQLGFSYTSLPTDDDQHLVRVQSIDQQTDYIERSIAAFRYLDEKDRWKGIITASNDFLKSIEFQTNFLSYTVDSSTADHPAYREFEQWVDTTVGIPDRWQIEAQA